MKEANSARRTSRRRKGIRTVANVWVPYYVEGKNQLRRKIQEKVAVYFRTPKLVDVMFTEFVIQL